MNRSLCLLLLVSLSATSFLPKVMGEAEPAMYAADDADYEVEEGEETEDQAQPPIITSKARTSMQVPALGETTMPCETDRDVQRVWLKDKTILFTDNIRAVNDKRYQRLPTGALKIIALTAEDTANYTCQLAIPEKTSITHQLTVLIEPKIVNWDNVNGMKKNLKKGDPLTLTCTATGVPAPSISWSRKGRRMPNGEDVTSGMSITFEEVTRKHIGVYECLATNNVGNPASKSVEVEVLYKPEIEIEKAIVNSGEGNDAELVCEAHANPRPKVTWLKDGVALPTKSDKYKITPAGSKHLLVIQNTQKSDFGLYTCHANNSLGREDRVVKLSGEPSPARYVAGEELETGQKLMWSIESHSPITKYTLKFKNKKSGEWVEAHPTVDNPEGNVYTVEHNLELTPGEYEAVLLSENTYGWSEPSISHLFSYKPDRKKKLVKGSEFGGGLLKKEYSPEASAAPTLRSQVVALLTVVSLSTFFL